ncbi:hypothetical protein GCE86_07650 [Micromonospora terminaliae]|uniref:Uncharacterized protein n=1 Tax=Micromonospora terminaliae TaxID=1914461 RepID=A0AAJ3DL18_9ACTN|nr:hypothetical protein [Micromonospora terminaliae]NES30301.1 hypothetical protein [Micromonospora terminaliae]QGL46939.1 hypothetical protein GCE86_07650 [Micromonospora terminaliae]
MTTLDDPGRLLAVWEAAAAAPPAARGPVLLHAAGLLPDLDAALDLPVGTVAALAARLSVDSFGDPVDAVLTCGCGEVLDVALPLDPVAGLPAGDAGAVAGGTLRVRAPTARDLLAAGRSGDPLGTLLARCVRDADGRPVAPGELTADQRRAVDTAAEELAGAAAVVLRTRCPGCGDGVVATLDVAELLWERVVRRAPAVLAEVAALAAAYGWAEADILALPAGRRRVYLALATGRAA